jgi:hypothetical protein
MIQNNFHNLNQIRNDTFHSIVDVRSVNPLGIVGDTAAIMRTCSLAYSAFKRRAHSPPPFLDWLGIDDGHQLVFASHGKRLAMEPGWTDIVGHWLCCHCDIFAKTWRDRLVGLAMPPTWSSLCDRVSFNKECVAHDHHGHRCRFYCCVAYSA